jgi:hypothetical protein
MSGIGALDGTAPQNGPQTFYYPPPMVHAPKPGYLELVKNLKKIILELVSNRDLITSEARIKIAKLIKDIYFEIEYSKRIKEYKDDFVKFLNLKLPDRGDKTLRSIVESCSDLEVDEDKKQILRCIKRYLLVAGASPKMNGLFTAATNDRIPSMTIDQISYYFYTAIEKQDSNCYGDMLQVQRAGRRKKKTRKAKSKKSRKSIKR